MPTKKYSAEEIIAKLREADVLLGQGKTVPETIRVLRTRRLCDQLVRHVATFVCYQPLNWQPGYDGTVTFLRLNDGPQLSRGLIGLGNAQSHKVGRWDGSPSNHHWATLSVGPQEHLLKLVAGEIQSNFVEGRARPRRDPDVEWHLLRP